MRTLGLLMAIALVAGVACYADIGSKRRELDAERVLLATTRKNLEGIRSKLAAMQQELQPHEDQVTSRHTLTESRQLLTGQIPALESARNDLLKEFMAHVQLVRARSMGMVLPDVRLESGQVLHGVKIQKLTESEVSLSHNQGIARIPSASLPADLRERLRIDMVPMKIVEKTTAPTASVGAPAAAVAIAPDAPPPAIVMTPAMRGKVAGLDEAIRKLELQRLKLSQTKDSYLRQAQDYRLKDNIALASGKTPTYQAVLPKIETAASDLNNQINELSIKITNLQIQVEDLKAGLKQ